MSRWSGGRKTILQVFGHPTKTTTSEKWARQAQRRGKGQIIDHVFYWHSGESLLTHRDRPELREIERLDFIPHGMVCDIAHEHHNKVKQVYGGPVFKTMQWESTVRRKKTKRARAA